MTGEADYIILKDLFDVDKLNTLEWKPFRPGVQFHLFHPHVTTTNPDGSVEVTSSSALLKYEPGASVPEHLHTGHEHIVIISGTQKDRLGVNGPGTLIINKPGSRHVVSTDTGCIVFIVWEKPISLVVQQQDA